MGHRNAVSRKVVPNLEPTSGFKELVCVSKKRVVSIVSFVSELAGKLKQHRFVAIAIELLAFKSAGCHRAAA